MLKKFASRSPLGHVPMKMGKGTGSADSGDAGQADMVAGEGGNDSSGVARHAEVDGSAGSDGFAESDGTSLNDGLMDEGLSARAGCGPAGYTDFMEVKEYGSCGACDDSGGASPAKAPSDGHAVPAERAIAPHAGDPFRNADGTSGSSHGRNPGLQGLEATLFLLKERRRVADTIGGWGEERELRGGLEGGGGGGSREAAPGAAAAEEPDGACGSGEREADTEGESVPAGRTPLVAFLDWIGQDGRFQDGYSADIDSDFEEASVFAEERGIFGGEDDALLISVTAVNPLALTAFAIYSVACGQYLKSLDLFDLDFRPGTLSPIRIAALERVVEGLANEGRLAQARRAFMFLDAYARRVGNSDAPQRALRIINAAVRKFRNKPMKPMRPKGAKGPGKGGKGGGGKRR
jgi:hypothetical protein